MEVAWASAQGGVSGISSRVEPGHAGIPATIAAWNACPGGGSCCRQQKKPQAGMNGRCQPAVLVRRWSFEPDLNCFVKGVFVVVVISTIHTTAE